MDLSTREGRKQQGDRIKKAAREAGVSLEDLAAKIGCSRALIYQYASGASLAQTDRLQLIAGILGKPLTWFFLTEDEPAFQPPQTATGQTKQAAPASEILELEQRRIRERIAHLRILATAFSTAVDWRNVVDTAQQLIPLLEHEEEMLEVAEVLMMQGTALVQMNDLGAARQKLHEAGRMFRELQESERALACLQSLGQANIMLGRTEEALHQFRQVAAGAEWTQRWQGTLSMGAAEEVLGNYRAAAAHFDRALEIVQEHDDPHLTGIARLYIDGNWANLELDWADYEKAAERSERCILSAMQLGIQDQYTEGLLNRGAALLGLHDYRLALSEIQRALNVSQVTRDSERWSLSLSCRALVMAACMRAENAVLDGKEALAIALRCGASRAEMLAQRTLSEAYLAAGNDNEARYHVDQGTSIANAMRLRLQQAQFGVLRGRLALRNGDAATANNSAAAACVIAEELGAKAVRYDCALLQAQSALTQGRAADARTQAENATRLAGEMRAPAARWRPLSIIAQAWDRDGKAPEAGDTYKTALEILDSDRRGCATATGEDTFLNNPDAETLWRSWLSWLLKNGRKDDAVLQAQSCGSSALQQWFAEQRTHSEGQALDA